MLFTTPSTRIASPPRLALLVAALMLLALTPQPADAQSDTETLTQEFESRCAVEGSLRMIPLHPFIGGSVPPLVSGTASVVRLDEPIPPGSYRVSYLSYDGYPGRESVRQSAERWVVEFFAEESADALLGTVGPTQDLDDFVTETYESTWPKFNSIKTITTDRETTVLAVKHASPPGFVGPQSVRPICINLLPIDPIPIVLGNACGGADLVFRNPDVAYGSSYRKLWKNAQSFELAEINPPLPPDSYRLIAASYDGYDRRPGSVWETDEVWVAEFWSAAGRLVATSSPTMDLPDGPGHMEATWEGPLEPIILDDFVRRVTVRHAASSDRAPNSVYASCLGVSWVDEPSLEDILRRSGVSLYSRGDNPTFAAGAYTMEILAEFTSGHTTNAVGFFYSGSDRCQIVLDGSVGGPGFAGSDPVQFTTDSLFGICVQGPSGTRYSTDSLNPGGERAAVVRTTSEAFILGFEDYIDGDFQDLVVRLSGPAETPILTGLPDALPISTVPWSQVDESWFLTLVTGPWDQGVQPQGLYLVSPDGNRWAVHASVRPAPGDVMGPILDWRGDEAMVLVSGPRDLVRIVLFDLTNGTEMDVTDRAGVTFGPKATFMGGAGDDLLTDYTWAGDKRLIQQTRERVEVTRFGPPLDPGTPMDWINAPNGSDIVITNGLNIGGSPGQVIYVQPGAIDTERIVAFEACTPLRWVRPDELAAVCDGVGATTGRDLWIVPMDGSPLWPVVDPAVTASLGVDGFRDMYQSGDRLYLESAAGEIWRLEDGCPVPTRSPLHDRFAQVDLVGADGPEVFFRHGQSLIRARFDGTTVVELFRPVGPIARSGNSIPTADGDFPSPPQIVDPDGFDTCPKQGQGQGALLTDIRWGLHPTFTRVVFEFDAERTSVPSWWTFYVDGPVFPDVVGDPIEGDALLGVVLTPSGTLDISTPPDNELTYDGPINIDVGIGVVETIDIVEDFEAYLEWVITLDQRRPYTVFTLTDPPRLVIDVTNDG